MHYSLGWSKDPGPPTAGKFPAISLPAMRFERSVVHTLSPISDDSRLRLHSRPHLVDIPPARFLFVLLPPCVPRPHAQKAGHIHPVDLVHPPAALQQAVVRRVDEIRQRRAVCVCGCSVSFSACAAFVGNSSRMLVVCVCSDTTRSRSVSLMRSHLPLVSLFV